jgi:hypothetical protein
MSIPDLRSALDRLGALAPPWRPDFEVQLHERIEADERRAKRRWRAAALVAAMVGAASLASTGVLALRTPVARTVDQTLLCPVPEQGGVNVLNLFARVANTPLKVGRKVEARPASIGVNVGTNTLYAGASVYEEKSGGLRLLPYVFDSTSCRQAAAVPFSHSGVPKVATLNGDRGQDLVRECWLAPLVRVRLRVTLSAKGIPTAATLAVRSGTKQRPVIYVDWAPTRISVFAAPSCMKA